MTDCSDSEPEEQAYVTPFCENGTIVEDELTFVPTHTSSPNNGYAELTMDSLLSKLGTPIFEDTIIVRPLAGRNQMRRIEDTCSEEDMILLTQSELRELLGEAPRWKELALWFLRYIDDGLSGGKLCNGLATTHILSSKEVRMIHAGKTETFLKMTQYNARLIGMKINAVKTQMICLNVAKHSVINSFINVDSTTQIKGGEALKMLGFMFGRRPNAESHVTLTQKKYYSKIWTVRHLLKLGASPDMLVRVYACFIRPIIEYGNVAYGCLLTEESEKSIENLQKYALKTIYGLNKTYSKCLELSGMDRYQKDE